MRKQGVVLMLLHTQIVIKMKNLPQANWDNYLQHTICYGGPQVPSSPYTILATQY